MKQTGKLTTSRPLPLNILSVVVATLPPFLWRSHMIVLLATCGNICCILSTSASRALILLALDATCEFRDDGAAKKKYLMTRPLRSKTKKSWRMLTLCSSAILTHTTTLLNRRTGSAERCNRRYVYLKRCAHRARKRRWTQQVPVPYSRPNIVIGKIKDVACTSGCHRTM